MAALIRKTLCRATPLFPGTPGRGVGGEGAEPAEIAAPLRGATSPLTPPSPPEYRGRGSRAQHSAEDGIHRIPAFRQCFSSAQGPLYRSVDALAAKLPM